MSSVVFRIRAHGLVRQPVTSLSRAVEGAAPHRSRSSQGVDDIGSTRAGSPSPSTRRIRLAGAGILIVAGLTSACKPSAPPTVTPVAPGAEGSPGTVFELTMPPPQAMDPVPVSIGELEFYADPAGAFSLNVPQGWLEARQPDPGPESEVKLGVVFQAPNGDGLLTITQFDNGRRPDSLGFTINNVLRDVTGWMNQPGYFEHGRESVIEREGDAMRVQISYQRSNGIPMHSLVLFQIDGTTFSMVNVGVEEGSWTDNEGSIRRILGSYQVPAATVP